jgi:hypothetical protein
MLGLDQHQFGGLFFITEQRGVSDLGLPECAPVTNYILLGGKLHSFSEISFKGVVEMS